MREYTNVTGIRHDRPMTPREIIIAGDNMREVERAANRSYGPVATTILATIAILGVVVYILVPTLMTIFR